MKSPLSPLPRFYCSSPDVRAFKERKTYKTPNGNARLACVAAGPVTQDLLENSILSDGLYQGLYRPPATQATHAKRDLHLLIFFESLTGVTPLDCVTQNPNLHEGPGGAGMAQ